MQYQDRIEDIRVLKLEIKKLRSEKALLQTETRNIAKLKAEVFYLQKEYLRETTKVKVLEGIYFNNNNNKKKKKKKKKKKYKKIFF